MNYSLIIDLVGILIILGFAIFFVGDQWWCYVPSKYFSHNGHYGSELEGFVGGGSSGGNGEGIDKELIGKFLDYQNIANPNTQFNISMLEEQVTPQEMEAYLRNGYWTWDELTQKEYMYAIARNPMLNIYPEESMRSAQKVYNGAVMKYMIEWNKKAHPERWKLEKGRKMEDYIYAPLSGTTQALGITV